ncbi:E3 ubiquitin-protein ligase RGLG5-like [Herrania umbratica]|uniref:E3 ubiquitin-protein ligase RGLG5-like n=1 Tax=Herrania umbratica TaxID=108875 RepID=A0A6J1B0R9_9ROSI|nr:E3 ubiquitin-protein ligase RGLG5-like [Herrania umbratica]XP_021292848.1 E3 ubiquitin-protein ligase RGLG5-like [Herrania umbratica]XP_021292849.1 E3 ubiquitin-protein ligase RGLG5-like [Herrania umbratica]XP_021292850.1 E3 ubiquitin-protein ligase RGLG5-like [Herrania umbratica]XP_021292851.1 E3 ubiquitin-protein ligase RGLG5-like [Herrania umbratica]
MGSKSSKESSGGRYPTSRSAGSDAWSHYGQPPQSAYPPENSYYTPQHRYAPPPSYNYGSRTPQLHKSLERKYSRIADNYQTLDQVTAALAQAGLESSNLIVGIDFTKSNEWTGARSFNRRSLHHIGNGQNPYEQAISIIGQSLSAFDEDNLIPCYGFGDASTHDQDVFSFYPEERFCNGFEEVLARYREIVPQLRLAGPTSFAPIIEMAMTIVEQSGGQYHVLLIIADGQVTRSVDTQHGQLSPQEHKTIDAIVKASEFPLSIVLVGVGDGPWDMMREFDDNIPARAFDNFQFVNFTEIMSKNTDPSRKQAEFALSALMEIPSQYKATIELGLLGRRRGNTSERVPLPPLYGTSSFNTPKSYSRSSSFQQNASPYSRSSSFQQNASYSHTSNFQHNSPPYSGYDTSAGSTTGPSSSSFYDHQVCPICLGNPKDMAFGCGHQTCCDCGEDLQLCPICRSAIQTRIRLY